MKDYIYHVGHLAVDRDEREFFNGPRTKAAAAIDELAGRIWHAYESGKVRLFQRRCLSGFEYICRPTRGA